MTMRNWIYLLACCFLSITLCAQTAQKKPATTTLQAATSAVALRGGKLLTISRGTIENGTLVMQDGKITAVGPAASVSIPKGAKVIDATGMTIYPGLIDSETRIGLLEIDLDRATNDMVETSDEIMPHMHVYDAFHAESDVIPVTRINGVTNVVVVPDAQDSVPGQDSFVQLDGRNAEEMILIRDNALAVNFLPDVRRNDSQEGGKFPSTRMGVAAQLRQAFIDAQDYARKWRDYEEKKSKKSGGDADSDKDKKEAEPPKRDLKLEALVPYLEGKKPVVLAAEEPSDVQVALRLAREFNLKIVLNRLTNAGRVLDQIAAAKIPAIVGPIYEDPKGDQRYDQVFRLPAELHKRGVKIAFASYDTHQSRNLPYAAGYAVAFGLPYDEALKAITLNPAEIWGVADRLGSLDVGKTANVVVANGDPLDVKTDVKRVFIAGREIPMVSRQTQLRDQYSK
ncbi:MAG: amidohydrolase family protein [Acidobacteriales bacterium]|nr:amidohydrolase family protein [Terriglobales bacterium]